TVCNGETPEAYIPEFTTTTVPLNEFCKVRQVFLDGNLLYADTICNGQNGEDGQNIDYRLLQYSENFNTASSYFLHNVMLWNVLGTQASSNHIGAPKINTNGHTESYNGTMVMDNLNSKDTVWCPLFIEPAALNYLKCDIGSGKDGYGLIFFVKYQNGQSEVLDSINIAGVPNFVWYDNTTWEYQEYVFEIPSKDIKRWDVVRWGLRFTSVDGSPMPEDKNLLPHLDNVHYTTLQIVQ
ncbi:MAG TPA: hypothetical protein VK153_00150, partial [Candidatus Paceibacterota bacterium]|nr:hypothetical protein [Candidatus Paceibacterota bacterium]